jgi:hypothetical protein
MAGQQTTERKYGVMNRLHNFYSFEVVGNSIFIFAVIFRYIRSFTIFESRLARIYKQQFYFV